MSPCTILIADDDKSSCLILRKFLKDHGHSCDLVYDGVEAVQAVCGKQYDLVFLDLYMPVLSGIHAAITIRSRRSTSPVIIGIASSVDGTEVSLCNEAGMAGIVLKPFDRELIARLIGTSTPQPAPVVREAKTPESVPQNSPPDDAVLARRSRCPQATCRPAIHRTTINFRLPARDLGGACMRSSALTPLCVWNSTIPATSTQCQSRPTTFRPISFWAREEGVMNLE